jgi:hypothetical protein
MRTAQVLSRSSRIQGNVYSSGAHRALAFLQCILEGCGLAPEELHVPRRASHATPNRQSPLLQRRRLVESLTPTR